MRFVPSVGHLAYTVSRSLSCFRSKITHNWSLFSGQKQNSLFSFIWPRASVLNAVITLVLSTNTSKTIRVTSRAKQKCNYMPLTQELSGKLSPKFSFLFHCLFSVDFLLFCDFFVANLRLWSELVRALAADFRDSTPLMRRVTSLDWQLDRTITLSRCRRKRKLCHKYSARRTWSERKNYMNSTNMSLAATSLLNLTV